MLSPLSSLRGAAALVVLALCLVAMTGTAAASTETSVTGSLIFNSLGDSLSISAHSTGDGTADGYAVYQNGKDLLHNDAQPQTVRVRITCLIPLADNTVIVGGTTAGATQGVGTIFDAYDFVLQDNGVGVADKFTLFAVLAAPDPCLEGCGPAGETALLGNIVIQ